MTGTSAQRHHAAWQLGCITPGVLSNGIMICEKLIANNVERNGHDVIWDTTAGSEETTKYRSGQSVFQPSSHCILLECKPETLPLEILTQWTQRYHFTASMEQIPLEKEREARRVKKRLSLIGHEIAFTWSQQLAVKTHPKPDKSTARPQTLYIFPIAQQPLVGQGLLLIEAWRSYSDTPHSVGLLWTNDQPVAETSTWQDTTLTRDIHAPDGIRTSNSSKRVLDSAATSYTLYLRSAFFWDITQPRVVYRRLGTTYRSHLQVSRSPWTAWPLRMGPIRCPETSVQNYHSTLSNIPEERRSHLQRDRSLKS
jgi:hypothetical protein